MHTTHSLAGIDLNLLVALHALLEERNVSLAAKRVGLSQSAMSHTLRRLREHFGDPLLVRSGRAMTPTATATALLEPTRDAVEHVDRLFRRRAVALTELSLRYRLVTDDYVGATLLPGLLARLALDAPGVDVEVRPRGAPGRKRMLREGQVDLALGYFSGAGMDLCRRTLFDEDWRCVGRAEVLDVCKDDPERWAQQRHILVSPTGGTRGAIDRALEARGLTRRVWVTVPHFLVAMRIAAETEGVLTLPSRLATRFAKAFGLAHLAPPIPLDGFEIAALWHPRVDSDPVHQALRKLVFSASRPPADAGASSPGDGRSHS